jgi:hypothetical protein
MSKEKLNLTPMDLFTKSVLCIVFISLIGKTFAQPVADFANVQLTGNYEIYVASVMSIGNPGANVTLDLSQAAFITTTITAKFSTDCPSTPYFSTFPSANLCITDNSYNYLILNKDSLVKIGQQNSTSSTIYSDPEVLVVFPMQYLDTYLDTYKSTDGENVGTVTLKYEAYGTLITQFGTFNNVITINRGDYHEFWTSNPFRILGQWVASKHTFYFYNQTATAVSTAEKKPCSIYPTLVNDKLYFSNTSDIKNIQIINSLGQLVLTKSLTSGNIDLSGISKGIYFVNVELNGEVLKSKIIKQ